MEMFKNRTVQICLGVVLLLAVFVVGYFLIGNKSKSTVEEDPGIQEQVVEKIEPEALGLTLTAKSDGKAVKFAIAQADGIDTIEYQLTYEADSTAQEQSEGGEPRVQRGITGEEKVTGKSTYESPWLDLGSCSKNVCRYDKGVTSVTLTLKVIKNDGKIYEVEQSLEL